MTPLIRLLSALLLACALAQPGAAQSPPTVDVDTNDLPQPSNVVLVADHVFLTGDQRLTAEGNVEALMDDVRMTASRIVYDQAANKITIEGPIQIIQGDADAIIVASAAELDTRFRNGLLRSARLVLAQQVQMAANQLNRVEGRYNVLTKTTVSSCRVCNTDEPPLWQIRARRVVHDQTERQVYFDHASLLIHDVPVLYFPHLRLPDPTLKRATGFLIPTIRTTSQLSYGIKVPYFIKMGQHRDLTLTPYVSSETRTMEFRYRQAFREGRIELNGAVSDDTIKPGETRGYIFAEGWFNLPRDFLLTFNLKAASDRSYLVEYDYSDDDRLISDITARRVKRDENTRFAILHYKSLRDGESNSTLPTIVVVAESERRYFPTAIGGELRSTIQAHGHQRRSDSDVVGRDVARLNASMLWRRNWTLGPGIRTRLSGELAFDAYRTNNDSTVSDFASQLTPTIAADIRYPLAKRGNDGATYILEPVAQLAWTGNDTLNIANDESTRVEFDEGNLLSLSRFPSYDRRERGLRAAVGLNWSRHSETGWRGNLTFGQVFHEQAQADFSQSSGLAGLSSDILLAGQFRNQNGLAVSARTVFDPRGDLSKAAARVGWSNNKIWLDASYVWLGVDAAEDRTSVLSEWALDSSYRISRHWTGLFDWRFDAGAGRTAEAGIGLEYRNECVKLELSLSRRFSTSSTVPTSTNFGFTVALLGFSVSSKDKSYARTCSS